MSGPKSSYYDVTAAQRRRLEEECRRREEEERQARIKQADAVLDNAFANFQVFQVADEKPASRRASRILKIENFYFED